MFKRFAIAGVSALVLAACADMPTETALADVDLVMAAAPKAKVALCHVTSDGALAGNIDLLKLPAKAAAQHIANPNHSFGGASDYLPGDTTATGIGSDDTDGNGIDDGCEIPSEPLFAFAVAYTDIDETDGVYAPGTDRLIAKLVDANANGVPDAGDEIHTYQYPSLFDITFSGAFTVTTHTIDSISIDSSSSQIIAHNNVPGGTFEFIKSPSFTESYWEYNTLFETFIGDDLGVDNGGDNVRTDVNSPSRPASSLTESVNSFPSFGDHPHIDVEFYLPGS